MKASYVAVAVVAFLSLSAVGFADGDGHSCHGDSKHGCDSNPEIAWVSPSSTSPGAAWVTCEVTRTTAVLTIAVSGLTPGVGCTVGGTLENEGQDAVSLSAHISTTEPRACPLYTYADNLLGLTHSPTLDAGKTFPYSAKITLGGAAGPACEGTGVSFTVTISSDGSSSCDGFPNGLELGSDGDDGCCH